MVHGQELRLLQQEILGEGLVKHGDDRLTPSKIDHSFTRLQNFSAYQKGCLGLSTAKVCQVGFVDESATQAEQNLAAPGGRG